MLAILVSMAAAHAPTSLDFSTTCDEPTYYQLLAGDGSANPNNLKYNAWSGPKAKGNPDSFWSIKGSWTKGKVNLFGGMGDLWSVEPTSGQKVKSIKFTTDVRVYTKEREAILVLMQDGKEYVGRIKPHGTNDQKWQTVSRTFRDRDFQQVIPIDPFLSIPKKQPKPGHPNFDQGCKPFQMLVGFIENKTETIEASDTIDYDNVNVHVELGN